MKIQVYATPALARAEALLGGTAVVIDVLRMTSVAATALANGCAGILPIAEVDEARRIAAGSGALLGGERNALPIEGFDFSNSPLEYTPERVRGRKLVMTTSNGTRAVAAASGAGRTLLGALINRSAVARRIRGDEAVAILCAGTLGAFTLEDALAAGSIVQALTELGVAPELDDMAIAAVTLYQAARGDLRKALARTAHFQRLEAIGAARDLDYCLLEDTLEAVPERGADGWFA